MLDLFLNNSEITETLSFMGTVTVIGAALFLGLCISLVYMYTQRKREYSASFVISLIMLPAIIAMIILLVGSNVARAFSLAGAFSLIRFRSTPGDPRDISYVFSTLGIGLACGMGFIGYAVLFAIILSVVMLVLTLSNFGEHSPKGMRLKIVLPENMDYNGTFDQILKEHTTFYQLTKIRTVEFGSLFELTYDITLLNPLDSKMLLDKLRCKNGNLAVTLMLREKNEVAAM